MVILLGILLAFPLFGSVENTGIVSYETRANNGNWTFMVYMDADNDLEYAGINDFLEMAMVGTNSNLNIVVQLDRIIGFSSSYGDWTDTKRFHITYGMTPTPSNATEDLGEINMGNPQSLIDFLQWGISTYPSEHYALILWDHGLGIRDFCVDDSNNDELDIFELKTALSATIANTVLDKIDIVGFDACLMSMAEIAYEIKDYANYMVASEQEEPQDGWPYNDILSSIVSNPDMLPIELGTVIVDSYYLSYESLEIFLQYLYIFFCG